MGVTALPKLTPKQSRFIEEYLVDLNATQAAIRAGYSEKTAKSIGQENLTKPYIEAAIEKARADLSERTEITQEFVIDSFMEIYLRCMQEITPAGKGYGKFKFDACNASRAMENIAKIHGFFVDKIDLSSGDKPIKFTLTFENNHDNSDR